MAWFNEKSKMPASYATAKGSSRLLRAGGAPSTARDGDEGPFLPAREQPAGLWLWEVRDLDEAVARVNAVLFPCQGVARWKSGRVTSPSAWA